MRRVVVITGGTAGVGRATARQFAREGAAVAVLARGIDRLDATVAEITALGGTGLGIPTDVAEADQVEAAAERIEAELGPIDVWINNAMTTVFGPALSMTPREHARVTDVCYHGYVWGTRAALSRMRPRGRGTIIQVGSALAYRSIPLQSAYCGAKAAIRGFTDSLRSELLHDRIAIDLCMMQLPAVNTPQFTWCENKLDKMPQPVPPIFEPEVIARALHRISLEPRREVYLGWSAIQAILGTELAPGFADRYLARRGYTGQLTGETKRDEPTNLFSPVLGDHGARGSFAARKRDPIAAIATRIGAAGVRVVAAAALAWLVVLATRAVSRALA